MNYILSLDEGTSSARAAVYQREGQRAAIASREFPAQYPHPGWVEQDAEAIWRAQMDSVHQALAAGKIDANSIAAIGITNQRETTVVWERATGIPVAPAIVWQCRRTADYCLELSKSHGETITRKTGLIVDAYFSASKIRWILENIEGARRRAAHGELLFGNIDTWLIWKLTGGLAHVTDVTNASRTMLMNLSTGSWDEDLLRLFDIPASMMPSIAASSQIVGTTSAAVMGAEIPIAGIAGDQQAALAGQACFRAGLSKNTYGTGCFALLHAGDSAPVSANRLLATRAASTTGAAHFAVEGSVFVAGAAIQWLRDQLKLIATAGESEAAAESVSGSDGVYLVPAFAGLGAPYWDGTARGSLTGLTRGTTGAHIVRAALESIAYQTRDLVEAMEADSGAELTELRVDGGATANNFLMQFQADILGKPIVRPADIETTALGAAYLAGLATGFWKSQEEVESFWRVERTFTPRISQRERANLYEGWKNAVSRTLTR